MSRNRKKRDTKDASALCRHMFTGNPITISELLKTNSRGSTERCWTEIYADSSYHVLKSLRDLWAQKFWQKKKCRWWWHIYIAFASENKWLFLHSARAATLGKGLTHYHALHLCESLKYTYDVYACVRKWFVQFSHSYSGMSKTSPMLYCFLMRRSVLNSRKKYSGSFLFF